MAAVLLGTALPIAPVQILWINMMTAITLGLTLAFEPKESGIMDRPPRDPRSPILTLKLIKRVGFVSLLLLIGSFGLFHWMIMVKQSTVAEAQTVVVNVIVVGEIFYLFNCRSLTRSAYQIGVLSNKAAVAGSIGMLLLQLLFTHTTAMNRLFRTAPIPWEAWLAVGAFGIALYVIVEIEKHLIGYTLQPKVIPSTKARWSDPIRR
jgi:Ca2+-transporting ATPase